MSTTAVLEPTGPNASLRVTGWLDRLLSTPVDTTVERIGLLRDLAGYEERPDPRGAHSTAAFLLTMRRYLVWAGDWSYLELEYLCGGAVKAATFREVLEGTELPKYVFLMAFVTACAGEDAGERERWVSAWRELRRSS